MILVCSFTVVLWSHEEGSIQPLLYFTKKNKKILCFAEVKTILHWLILLQRFKRLTKILVLMFLDPQHITIYSLDTKSPRNFLRLCSTKGESDSCHDMFYNFRLSLIYDPLRRDYQIFSVDNRHRLHKKRIKLSPEAPPYRRLLCWRFKKALLLYCSLLGTDAPAISDAIDFSDTTSSVRSADNEMSSSMPFSVLSGDGKSIMMSKISEKKTKNKSRKSRPRCYECYERGHLKKDCPNRRILQSHSQRHILQTETTEKWLH